MLKSIVVAAALAFAVPVAAQAPAPRDLKAQAAAMNALSFLHGEFLGQGVRTPPGGQPVNDSYLVRGTPKAGGLAMTIEAMTLRQGAEGAKPTPGSFAVVTYDDRTKRYVFRSFGFREMIVADAELTAPQVFRWTVSAGPALLRFTVDGTAGTWSERGERSADGGKTWSPTNSSVSYRTGVR